jgi:hypothetical protein
MSNNRRPELAGLIRRVRDLDPALRDKLLSLIGPPDRAAMLTAMRFLAKGAFIRDRQDMPCPLEYKDLTWAIALGYVAHRKYSGAGMSIRVYELTDTGRASIAAWHSRGMGEVRDSSCAGPHSNAAARSGRALRPVQCEARSAEAGPD